MSRPASLPWPVAAFFEPPRPRYRFHVNRSAATPSAAPIVMTNSEVVVISFKVMNHDGNDDDAMPKNLHAWSKSSGHLDCRGCDTCPPQVHEGLRNGGERDDQHCDVQQPPHYLVPHLIPPGRSRITCSSGTDSCSLP